jgi:ABC-type uncharacterized transport system auxiliary subunit
MTRSIFNRIPASDLNPAQGASDFEQRDSTISSLRNLGGLCFSAVKPLLHPGLIFLLMSTALFGCMGKVRYPTYYTLHVAPATDPPPKEQPIVSIAIREFRAPAYLRQGPIVFHSSPEQLGFYEYHRWAVDPREFVANAIADRLRASGRFALVKMYDGHPDVDYVLSGTLSKLEEVDEADGAKVEVGLTAQITELGAGSTVWSGSVTEGGRVTQKDVPGVVAEMSKALDQALDKLVASVTASIDTTRKPGGGR